ncbi:MAG: hypothetical protein KC656_29140 [Myxococcales bacterium]|nr:hypothetical protein [Myxococcales bacterium]
MLLWLIACTLEEDDFERRRAVAFCSVLQSCDPDNERLEDGTEGCRDIVEDELGKGWSCGTYDPAAGSACLGDTWAITCEEMSVGVYPSSCADVWTGDCE